MSSAAGADCAYVSSVDPTDARNSRLMNVAQEGVTPRKGKNCTLRGFILAGCSWPGRGPDRLRLDERLSLAEQGSRPEVVRPVFLELPAELIEP